VEDLMREHRCVIQWHRRGEKFIDNCYQRDHEWRLNGTTLIAAAATPTAAAQGISAAPAAHTVIGGQVEPEEAFIASLASYHMLWFLTIAAQEGWTVDTYRDEPTGRIESIEIGQMAMTIVRLRPHVRFTGAKSPKQVDVGALHDKAHAECFLAKSVKTTISIEPTWEYMQTPPQIKPPY
jgi:organic hydroperoxide reductase OsmC/OhrA